MVDDGSLDFVDEKVSLDSFLRRTEESIQRAKESGADLTQEFQDSERLNYSLQEAVRLETRGLSGVLVCELWAPMKWWTPEGTLRDDAREFVHKALYALQEARDIFGSHPFHHVIEGRLISVVTAAVDAGVVVPPEFNQYAHREIKPYENPGLNYRTPRDIPAEHPEMVPPGWSP